MKHRVKIKAIGENASGKSYFLKKIKTFLENEGFKVDDKYSKDNHEIVVVNEH